MAENQALRDNRYSKTNPPPESRHKKHPNGYLTPILKKLLNKKMTINDVEVQKIFNLKPEERKAKLKKIIMLRYILNAVQGENKAIEGIFERMDGKVAQKLLGEGFGKDVKIVVVYPPGFKKQNEKDNGNNAKKVSGRISVKQ